MNIINDTFFSQNNQEFLFHLSWQNNRSHFSYGAALNMLQQQVRFADENTIGGEKGSVHVPFQHGMNFSTSPGQSLLTVVAISSPSNWNGNENLISRQSS